MKGMNFFLLLGVMVILSAQPAYAWGPSSHTFIFQTMKDKPDFQSSPFYNTIMNNEQYYLAGMLVPDITVLYYLSAGGEYPATHNWAFVDCFTSKVSNDRELAVAYGMALGHQVPDAISHNQYVPSKIRSMYVPNVPLHPIVEAQFEALIMRDRPEIFEKTRSALQPILNDQQIIDKLQDCVSQDIQLDVKAHLMLFDEALADPEGFYTKQFKLPDIYNSFAFGNPLVGFIFLIIAVLVFYAGNRWDIWLVKWMMSLIVLAIGAFFLIGGIAALSSEQQLMYWVDYTAEEAAYVSNQGWQSRYSYDPTGFSALTAADAQIIWVWWTALIIKIAMWIFIIYWKMFR